MDLAAAIEARRRRATALDEADFDRGFDLVAGSPQRYRLLDLVADLSNAFGSGLIGFAINIYTGGSAITWPGHVAMLAGVALTLAGIAIKYARQAG